MGQNGIQAHLYTKSKKLFWVKRNETIEYDKKKTFDLVLKSQKIYIVNRIKKELI